MFEMFNEFETTKIILETVLRIVLITCKPASRKLCLNIEDKNESSQFIYTSIIVTITIKLLAFVTPPSIYQFLSPISSQ